MKRFSILLGALSALLCFAGAAHADTRGVYTITNIPVDKTASNSQEAEDQAFATAQVTGLYRLMEKLTLPDDRSVLGLSFYSLDNARKLTAAVDVDDVRRSSTVYRANLSVVYNPNLVREALNARGVPFVDRQAPLSLIAPVVSNPVQLDAWRRAWPQADNGALNPFATALSNYSAGSDWEAFKVEADAVGARNVVIAELKGSEGSYSVQLVRVSSAGRATIGTTGQVATVKDAVLAASSYLDAAWKRQAIVRGGDVQSDAQAIVRYTKLSSWNRLRTALANSPLVSGFSIDALARDGALVSFTFAGDTDRLARDLEQSGVVMSGGPGGMVLQLAGDRVF